LIASWQFAPIPEGKLTSEVNDMERTPEMKKDPEWERFKMEELQCEVLEDIINELKAQGRWAEPGSVDKQIELALEMENQEYESLEEQDAEIDMEYDDVN
jgi:hypothetical protein